MPFNDDRSLRFSYNELLDSSFFNNAIIKNMSARVHYYVLIKLRYLDDNFVMLGCQIPFKFQSYSHNKIFNQILKKIFD